MGIASTYILVADDDPDDLLVFTETFGIACPDIRMVPLADGEQVCAHLKEHDRSLPILIVLDYNMPKMSGADVLRALHDRPQYASISKIVLTGSDRETERHECLALGATHVFIKPDNGKDLLQIVAEMCDLLATGARYHKA